VRAFVEMMNGAAWVRDRLTDGAWEVEAADARQLQDIAPLPCKTDRVDARVLAELCRRDLVPALRLPSLEERALRSGCVDACTWSGCAARPRTAASGC
jgi:transposase